MECGRGKRRRAPPPPVTEGQLRRLIFFTYAKPKEVSAEGYPIFSEEEFVAGCEEALDKKKAKLQKKKP